MGVGAALLGLSVLIVGALGLRAISQGEDDCSQPGIMCTIKSSSCFDFNWLRSFTWTPNAPSHMEVTVGIGKNEMGLTVPVLQINWTVAMDSSIQSLQGVEISVFEHSTQINRCVQLQFNNAFLSQRNPSGQPWQFYYNNFEVNPGQEYDITVQHLPKLESVNNKRQTFVVPRCTEGDMMKTDTCCNLGLCWFPSIEVKQQGENLTVKFSSRWDAQKYGVQVKVRDPAIDVFQKVSIQQGSQIQRIQVTFPYIGDYTDKECVYNISVWPYMPPCANDCVRQYYVPPCATETPPLPEQVERWYLWSVAFLLTMMTFGGILLALRIKDCINPVKVLKIPPTPSIPPPTRKKVWLVYSADHKHYIPVVIKLADFMQLAWGLDVVLDRLHVQEMGMIGPMAWLDRQKDEITRTNGTILILCSRGAQEKWKAMQNVKEQKITLREDQEHPIGDLFTPALSLILPDFQKALPYDRYVVAYFGNISTLADIPSLFEICPKYSLTENLQELFFRIQRQEQHQPCVQLTIDYEKDPSYRHLLKAMEWCREWQEGNFGWFERECLMLPVEDLGDTVEEDSVDDNATREVYPEICYPETSVCMVRPLLLEKDPVKALDPKIVIGAPNTQVDLFLSDIDPSVSVVQPLLFPERTSAVVCKQEPYLVGEAPLLGEPNNGLLRPEVSILSDQGLLSIAQLREAQKSFYQDFLDNPDLPSDMEFMTDPNQYGEGLSLDMAGDQRVRVGEQFNEIFLHEQLMTPPMDPGTGLPDQHSVQVADQGYSSWNPREVDLAAIKMQSLKLFLQNEGDFLNYEQV